MTEPPTETGTTLEARAEEIVREHDALCAGSWVSDAPWCSAAPKVYDLCIACAALRDKIVSALAAARAEGERQGLEQAADVLRPFANFAEKFNAKPLRGIADEFYVIHSGDDGAALRLSDCQRALDLLSRTRAEKAGRP